MSHEPESKSSLTHHLVWGMFLRQLIFLTSINLLVVFLSGSALVMWAEHSIAKANAVVLEYGLPDETTRAWLEVSNFEISLLDRPATGISLHPREMFQGNGTTGMRHLSSIYTIEFPHEQGDYAISMDLGGISSAMRLFLLVLLVIELFFLCSGLFAYHRSIHHSLQPIQDLANTTALAGELAKINANQLDSRISLSNTEKELKTLAHAINSMLDRVAEAYEAQTRFVSDASHELRTPIAVILGYSSMLDRWGKSNPETLQESIDAIREEASSMERLIEQLLFLARGDHQSQPLQKIPLDVSAISAEVLREEGMLYPEHELIAHWDGQYNLQADPTLIKQLLRILVDNSLKYTQIPGKVWLSLHQTPQLLSVTIEDEGMGIPPESLPQIFQRFYRTDTSRTRQTGGTGLGLSIALWIVSQHNGWFEVISREEIGTKITVFLPKGDNPDA